MKTALKFKLDRIPAPIGQGYKAKMCARTARDARDALAGSPDLQGVNASVVCNHLEFALAALFAEAERTGDLIKVGDYFTIEPHVRGRFDGVDDTFDPMRGHHVALALKAGSRLKAAVTGLQPENELPPIRARVFNVLSQGVPEARHNHLVFGHPLSVVGRNLELLEGDAVHWQVRLPGHPGVDDAWTAEESFLGDFDVLENDAGHLLLAWPHVLPRRTIGHTLAFTLDSRGGNPEAVRRTVVRHWPIS